MADERELEHTIFNIWCAKELDITKGKHTKASPHKHVCSFHPPEAEHHTNMFVHFTLEESNE